MDASEREEPDRDPVMARKTSRPCAIEDGEVPTTGWARLKRLFRKRARPEPSPADLPPLEPHSIPEPVEEDRAPEEPESF
ncbi:MAG: hypothetical protein PHI34_10730 [Acidobacteriota bacterium]|nr:hypothetical protein [Acidobacteriota bacterium]